MTNICKIPDPAYSPDLAPSDLFLFGLLKEKLRGTVLTDEEDFISGVWAIFDEISESILTSVDVTWIK
jgi:hypothetical protein